MAISTSSEADYGHKALSFYKWKMIKFQAVFVVVLLTVKNNALLFLSFRVLCTQ